jgi:hypothetical protein
MHSEVKSVGTTGSAVFCMSTGEQHERISAPHGCDREGARACLDAVSERNKRAYERHGFQAEDPFAPPGGPPLWPMWRQPASDR